MKGQQPHAEGPAERPILVHPPLAGDLRRVTDEQRNDASLDAPPVARALPPSVRDPRVHQLALAASAEKSRVRVFGLDAVRGLCLLAMNLTFALPYEKLLPAWMYHMQYPPPDGKYVAIPGLTWQDIIFPGFLFAMAAAIPIRNTQLLAAGQPAPKVAWGSIQRAALLYLFSLIIAHVNPFYTQDYTKRGNLIAIFGFLTCFALFLRKRDDWDPRRFAWVRRAGWAAAAIILFLLPPTWNATFSLTRRDNIITSIAFIYALGSIIWLLTRGRTFVRLLVMFAVAVLKLLAPVASFSGAFWSRTPVPWLYEPWFFELLLIAIPGTIAGDLLVSWTKHSTEERTARASPGAFTRLRLVAALGMAAPLVLLIGLYHRRVTLTTLAIVTMVGAGALLLGRLRTGRDRLLTQMGGWTAALLVVGILLEPLEGGIKKDPQTMSFLLLCAGLWFAVLLASTILIDVIGGAVRRIVDPLILAGQNAMLAYVIFMLFFNHIAYFLGFGDFLSATPGEAAVRSLIVISIVMTTLWLATRYRIVWRS